MPIKKIITDKKGMVTRHHRIRACSITEELDGEYIDINLTSYANKAIWDLEVAEGENLSYTSMAIRLPLGDGNISKANLYARIRAEIPEFAGATEE